MPEANPGPTSTRGAVGCYGLRFTGIDGARRHLVALPDGAPTLHVEQRPGFAAARPPEAVGDTDAVVHLSDGTGFAELRRATPGRSGPGRAAYSVTVHTATAYDDEALLHPMLAGSAAVVNRWLGHDSFHAGAFGVGDAAWAVMGDKGRGKSTTLGYLALRGVPVLSDDLVVEDGGSVWSGPAFVDLRPDASVALGAGRDVGVLGARARVRLDVAPVAPRWPLAGWIVLAWGEEVALRPVPVARRVPLLLANATVRLPPTDPTSYLRHAARPFYELTRPKDWSSLPQVHDVLAGLGARTG